MNSSDNNQSIFDDASTSFKSLITERFTSPFLFSFVLSWLVINHKLLILALSSSTTGFSIQDKLNLFNMILNSTYIKVPFFEKTLLLNGFTWPLLSALFYTFVYPYADFYITEFTLNSKVKLRNLRVRKEQELYFTFDDIQKIYSKHADDENRWKLRMERLEISEAQKDVLIKELQSKIDSQDETKNSKGSVPELPQDELDTKLDLAKVFIDMEDFQGASSLIDEVLSSGDSNQKRRAKRLIKKIDSSKNELNADKNEQQISISKNEFALINTLGLAANNLIDWVKESEVLKSKNLKPIETKIAINDLLKKDLIARNYRSGLGGYCLQLTVNGMKVYNEQAKELVDARN